MSMFVGPALNRNQHCFLQPTLEESIAPDHPVRVFDFVLDQHDWSEWQARYPGGGRPAYPPELMCKLLVYGYSIGIRSSRTLEHACGNSRDFIWLMSGRVPDHDTIADFRRQHRQEFKKIFRASVAACVEAGMVSLKHLVVDGTRVAASNGRQQTRTAEQIEALLKQLEERLEKVVAEAEETDRREDDLFGRQASPHRLPPEFKDIRHRQEELKRALEKVKAKMARSEARGVCEEELAAKRVPVTDADSEVMKDKHGDFGPNYGPDVGVDGKDMVIVSEGVTAEHTDDGHLQPAMEEAEETTGQAIEQVQADAAYPTPANLEYCEEAGIDPCMAPHASSLERPSGSAPAPAWPEGVPTQVAGADGAMVDGSALPRGPQGQFCKSAFRYDAAGDCYLCPRGEVLRRMGGYQRRLKDGTVTYTAYRCSACQGCPWASVCTRQKNGRVIKRGEHEEIYARHARRMEDPQRRADYKLRRQTVEPVFGILKEVLKLRRFLLRGLEGVRAEWSLACTAFNFRRLARVLGLEGLQTRCAVVRA